MNGTRSTHRDPGTVLVLTLILSVVLAAVGLALAGGLAVGDGELAQVRQVGKTEVLGDDRRDGADAAVGGLVTGDDELDTLDLTEHRNESDEEFDVHGVKVICDPKSHIYLQGVSVDFKDEVMGRGFVFNNPNATHTCGCGSSFSA